MAHTHGLLIMVLALAVPAQAPKSAGGLKPKYFTSNASSSSSLKQPGSSQAQPGARLRGSGKVLLQADDVIHDWFLDIYSALRDHKLREVQVFVDFNPSLFKPPLTAAVISHCVFGATPDALEHEAPASLRRMRQHPGHIATCPSLDPAHKFLALQLSNGYLFPRVVVLEDIELARQSGVASCIAPLFTQRPYLAAWLRYHVHLGVDAFHVYIPTVHAVDMRVLQPSEYSVVPGIRMSPVEQTFTAFRKFDHPRVVWHSYATSTLPYYFSQTFMYNECVARLRYSHEYAILTDIDEWITWNRTRSAAQALHDFLGSVFPADVAGIQLYVFDYSLNCPVTMQAPFLDRYRLREAVDNGKQKTVVRPKYVAEVSVHHVPQAAEGYRTEIVVASDVAWVKQLLYLMPVEQVCCGRFIREEHAPVLSGTN